MNLEPVNAPEISAEEWAQMSPNVKRLLEYLVQGVSRLEAEVGNLREQLKRNSGNSSQPACRDEAKHKVVKSGHQEGANEVGKKGRVGIKVN